MATTTLTKNISLKRKVDIILDYIFQHKENMFWNALSDDEQKELQKRQKGKFDSFDKVRKELLGK
ncbi:MAG: hypothetical protein WC875_04150 [Candidatus Absconditabacterales bacterium]